MRKILRFIFMLSAVGSANFSVGQIPLTLEEAIRTGLQNHYSILLAKNEEEAARYAKNIGNAGMLPSLNLNGGLNFSSSKINQEFASGLVVDQDGVRADNYNAAVQLNWVLFDGLKMFATWQKLSELHNQSQISTKIQIENIVSQIILSYCNIVKQQQIVKGLRKNLEVYEERLKIAEKKFSLGSGAKLDLLQAKIDLNAQKSALITQENLLYEYKVELNRLIVRQGDTEFDTQDSVDLVGFPSLEELRKSVYTTNNTLQFSEKNIQIARLQKNELRSARMPQLSFVGSYVFARSQNQAGFSLFNQSLGLNAGLNLSYNLFNGWKTNTQIKTAKLQMENARLRHTNIEAEIDARLLKAYKNYIRAKEILAIEEESIKLSEENLAIAIELFRLGQITTLQMKQAQQSQEEAITRLATARYNIKAQEVELMLLNGKLVSSEQKK